MSTPSLLDRALELARTGDVNGAVTLLEGARSAGLSESERTLLFSLLSSKERFREAIDVATDALAPAPKPFSRSNWLLRRALLLIEVSERERALVDLLEVQKLRANEGHLEQARAALPKVAVLKKR